VSEDEAVLEDLVEYFKSRKQQAGEEFDLSERLQDIINRLRKHRVSIPDSFIAIARVLITVGGFMKTYDVPFSWSPESAKLLISIQ
jgi:predicted unusual protein kinase regulating ubiquinone biosynthesis (AarF/ABC1/UbiB family)